jgi:hypothetical protein
LGGFERWDSAWDVLQALRDGWIDLHAVDAVTYRDVLEINNAIADYRSRLLASLRGEAKARGKDEGWVAREFERLTHA